ncbi:MAG: hypothetical protein KBT27_09270 [Prevotellaceae bacterium]|nr:hypothetical protein [Candidatus Faecinaster equi]
MNGTKEMRNMTLEEMKENKRELEAKLREFRPIHKRMGELVKNDENILSEEEYAELRDMYEECNVTLWCSESALVLLGEMIADKEREESNS